MEYLLAPEIKDAEKLVAWEQTRDGKKDWNFFRNAAKEMMLARISNRSTAKNCRASARV